jgi:hypothetical protein
MLNIVHCYQLNNHWAGYHAFISTAMTMSVLLQSLIIEPPSIQTCPRKHEKLETSSTCLWTRFGYKLVYSLFATTHDVAAYKAIHMYYLKKSHDSLNKSCDLKYMWMILLSNT